MYNHTVCIKGVVCLRQQIIVVRYPMNTILNSSTVFMAAVHVAGGTVAEIVVIDFLIFQNNSYQASIQLSNTADDVINATVLICMQTGKLILPDIVLVQTQATILRNKAILQNYLAIFCKCIGLFLK